MSNLPTKPQKEDRFTEYIPVGGKDKVKLSIGIVRNLLAKPTKKGQVASDNDCLKFIAMCGAKALNPFEGDAFLVGYDGVNGPEFSQITAHQVYLKRAEANPSYDGMCSGIIVMNDDGDTLDIEGDYHTPHQKVVGGWATVYRKDRKNPDKARVRLSRFYKDNQFWKGDEAGMVCKCAEADALRRAFPSSLCGLYMREELFTGNGQVIEVSTPKFDQPQSFLNPASAEPPVKEQPADTIEDVPQLLKEKAAK